MLLGRNACAFLACLLYHALYEAVEVAVRILDGRSPWLLGSKS